MMKRALRSTPVFPASTTPSDAALASGAGSRPHGRRTGSVAPRLALLAVFAATIGAGARDAVADTATWTGADGLYTTASNWDSNPLVPLNNGIVYDVFIHGSGTDVTYDSGLAGTVSSLNLGSGVTFLTTGAGSHFSAGATLATDASLIAENQSILDLGSGNLDRTNLVARRGGGGTGGATLTTTATSWTGTNGFALDRAFTADGAGTLLDLSSLTTVERSGGSTNSDLNISASDGGQVDLSGLGGFTDNASGTNGLIRITAEGAGSGVDLSGVSSISDAQITVRDGGDVSGQLVSLTGRSQLLKRGLDDTDGDGVDMIDLSALVSADNATLIAEDGATLALGAASIDRSDLIAQKGFLGAGGATLTTTATSWTGTNGFALDRAFTADGAGTLLDLSSLTTVERSGGSTNSDLNISASDGGQVDLSGISGFTDNASGTNGVVRITASGAGSTIDLSAVTALDRADVTIDDTASVDLGQLASFDRGTIALDSSDAAAPDLHLGDSLALGAAGVVDVAGSSAAVVVGPGTPAGAADGTLSVAFGGMLSGTGTVIGTLVNGGVLGPGNSPGTFSVDGDFEQAAAAILAIEIGGLSQGSLFDLLDVSGGATLAGDVEVSLFGGYVPPGGESFVFLEADGGISGQFDNVFCTNCSGIAFELVHGTHSVSLNAVAAPVPLPPAAWLLGAGVAGLALTRRRSGSVTR